MLNTDRKMRNSSPNLFEILLSDYSSGLIGEVKQRYLEKLRKICVISCPFIKESFGWAQGSELISFLPKVEYPDIYLYA